MALGIFAGLALVATLLVELVGGSSSHTSGLLAALGVTLANEKFTKSAVSLAKLGSTVLGIQKSYQSRWEGNKQRAYAMLVGPLSGGMYRMTP